MADRTERRTELFRQDRGGFKASQSLIVPSPIGRIALLTAAMPVAASEIESGPFSGLSFRERFY